MLTVIVFILDVLTPSEIAVWTLYLVPLGLTRWSYIQAFDGCHSCGCMHSAHYSCSFLYNPGPTQDIAIAIMNRVLANS